MTVFGFWLLVFEYWLDVALSIPRPEVPHNGKDKL